MNQYNVLRVLELAPVKISQNEPSRPLPFKSAVSPLVCTLCMEHFKFCKYHLERLFTYVFYT